MTGRRDLCIMACIFCKDPEFGRWIQSFAPDDLKSVPFSEEMAKAFMLDLCQIDSRNQLDINPRAAQRFHELVRKPYLAWKNPEQGDDTFYSGLDIGGAP